MIEITNLEVTGFKAAIRGMRNPMNSWDKSDSEFGKHISENDVIGENDMSLMKRLFEAGTDHRKFMRMIVVYMDINAPLYWWKEFDTYKVGTVANSCSTMHKIHAKKFELSDFSTDKLNADSLSLLEYQIIPILNKYRLLYNADKNKSDWFQMIQLLPTSYNQKRTVMINYETLANMYFARKNHKQDEWREFCKIMLYKLPYFRDIINK